MKLKLLIKRIFFNSIINTLLIYVSSSWIILEITDYFITYYYLNEATRDVLLIILVILLPIALFIVWYINRDKNEKTNEKTATSTKKALERIEDSDKQKENKVDLTSVYSFKIIETSNKSSFAELTVGIRNNSKKCAENVMLLISIEYPENILNGGYHSGRNFFSKNKAQLYADMVYPGITQVFEKVKVKEFDKLFIIATIVAKNMRKKHEKIYAINRNGEITVNHLYTIGGDLYSWIEILKKT